MPQQTPESFIVAVRRVVSNIPRGQVMSYATVATVAHFPRAARAVGTLMKQNFDPAIPCHRVIYSDGRLGQYNRGSAQKARLLRSEGVTIKNGRVIGVAT